MMAHLASAFADRDCDVDLLLGRCTGHFLDDIPSAVRVVDLGGPRLSAMGTLMRDPATLRALAPALANAHPPWILGCVPALVDYLRRERPETLLSALNYSNIAALWARRLSGVNCRVVVSERNTLSVRAANEGKRRYRVLPDLVRHFYPWADQLIAVSEGVARDLERVMELPRGRVATTYNPVIKPELASLAAAAPPHLWFDDEIPVVFGCGKLKAQKDFPTLLRAFARLRRERPLRLVIAGEGPERKRLISLATELGVERDVAFPGFVKNPYSAMARASVFVLSSAWEGLPNVLIEAMACGAPVVSTDCPSGPWEILEGGLHGPLVPVGDDLALAEATAKTLDAPPPALRLRSRAADYSIEHVALRYLAAMFPEENDVTKEASRSATI